MTAATPATEPGRADESRALNLDALRALAALYVLAGHAYLLSGRVIGLRDRHPVRLAINSGGSGVWLFFALSGYLISAPFVGRLLGGDPLPDAQSYARRRFFRIYPAYWVAFVAVLAFGLAPGQSVSVGQVIVHAALLHNLVPDEQQAIYFASWTLSLEVLFYAAVPLVALAIRRVLRAPVSARSLMLGVLVLWAGSIVFVAAVPSVATGSTQLWLRILFPSMVSMFCPGLLVAIAVHSARHGARPRWFEAIAEHRRASLLAAGVLAVAGAVGATAVPIRVYDASRQLFAVASGIVLVLALTRGPVRAGGSLLRRLGEISYGIYLWQGVIIYVLLRHEQVIPMRHTGMVAYVVHVGVLLATTLPVAWSSWHLLERRAIAAGRPAIPTPRPSQPGPVL